MRMRWVRTIVAEIFGLFVDDGSLAVAILLWVAVAWLALPRLQLNAFASGLALFAGLALILAVSVLRYSKRGGS